MISSISTKQEHFYILLIICLHTVKVLPSIEYSVIKYQSFVYTQLNVKTILFQAIQFSITTQFTCQTVLFDP